MPAHSHIQQQTTHRLLWSGFLAVGILWLLAACSIGDKTENSSGITERSVDMPLHANGETTLALKRFFKRANNQSSSTEPSPPIWALAASEFIISPPPANQNQFPAVLSANKRLYQFQALNVPRAPPLV